MAQQNVNTKHGACKVQQVQPFLQPNTVVNETNGPKAVATVSNQIYLPFTCDLSDYRHLLSKILCDF